MHLVGFAFQLFALCVSRAVVMTPTHLGVLEEAAASLMQGPRVNPPARLRRTRCVMAMRSPPPARVRQVTRATRVRGWVFLKTPDFKTGTRGP